MAAVHTQDVVDARPAEPLLASQAVSDQELSDLLEAVCGEGYGEERRQKDALGIGIKSLDEALGGGIESRKIVGLSHESGAGGSELCRVLLANFLLKHRESNAAVLDTTGNFDILRLYALMLAQLQHDPSLHRSILPESADLKSPEDVAAGMLDHVKIMRVFDFVGMSEAVNEIRDELEGRKLTQSVHEVGKAGKKDEETGPANVPPIDPTPRKRTFVADSEDDDEDDDEMLFDSCIRTDNSIPIAQQPIHIPEQDNQAKQHAPAQSDPNQVKFILIDNLAQVLNPLLKKHYVRANALAFTFLHNLHDLTAAHDLYTIVVNPTTTAAPTTVLAPRPSSPTRRPPHNTGPARYEQPPQPQPPSIFASSTAVPQLANVLARHIDLGLLLTRVPRRRRDARVQYGDAGSTGGKLKKGVEMVSVLEVLSDRWGGRVGAWGVFVVDENGLGPAG